MSHPSSRAQGATVAVRRAGAACALAAALSVAGCDGSGLSSASAVDAAVPGQHFADAAPPPPDSSPSGSGTPQSIGEYGQLGGGLSGFAWVAGGTGTSWIAPSPCNSQGCFVNTGGMLCAQGSIAALTCTSPSSCDWDSDWGAMIGWNPTPVDHEPWGAAAAAGIAVAYAGTPGEYRLMAHLAGDPDSKTYCVESYASGSVVTPSAFLSQCWANTGDVLPSFAVVDVFGLQLISAQHPIDFDVCISAITLF